MKFHMKRFSIFLICMRKRFLKYIWLSETFSPSIVSNKQNSHEFFPQTLSSLLSFSPLLKSLCGCLSHSNFNEVSYHCRSCSGTKIDLEWTKPKTYGDAGIEKYLIRVGFLVYTCRISLIYYCTLLQDVVH